ncbi:MAG: hypothetical protein WA996_15675 [Candidatus Promineifilaceae bacterium]
MLIVAGTIVFEFYTEPVDAPVEITVISKVTLFLSGFPVYYMLLYVVLPLRLSRCQFKLQGEEPVGTEVVAQWSGMMNYVAYMFAIMLAPAQDDYEMVT